MQGEMDMDLEMIIMNIINYSGQARSLSMEAIQYGKTEDFEKARENLDNANENISKAHKSQTELIQSEARGDKQELTLLLVHAQDHLMNAITIRDMAREFVDLYEIVLKGEDDLNA